MCIISFLFSVSPIVAHFFGSFFSFILPSLPAIYPYFLPFSLLEASQIPTIYGPDRDAHNVGTDTHIMGSEKKWRQQGGSRESMDGWRWKESGKQGQRPEMLLPLLHPCFPHKHQLYFSSLYWSTLWSFWFL